MARKKVNLAWISNDSTRRATFKKRKRGLIKKASELSTLCDVKACVVIYGSQEPEPEIWPSPSEGIRVLSSFKSMPEMEQCKKMVDQEGFLRQRLTKSQEQLRKMERENRELEMNLVMHNALPSPQGLQGVNTLEDATGLALMVEIRLKLVQDSIDQMKSAPLGLTMASQSNRHQMQVQEEKRVENNNLPMDPSAIQGWYNPGNNMGFGCTEEMMMMMQAYSDGPCSGNEFFPLN